jgi:hypothetical protein
MARQCCTICSTPPSGRYKELDQTKPPAFLLYVDQGEELYVRAEARERRRFSELMAQVLPIRVSMRADFLGEPQKDKPLFEVHRKIDVPPLREAELCEVVSRPAELLSAWFETAGLADIITRRTAEDSAKDVGALPLLSYTLDDMWTQMVERDDGMLRLPVQSFELGGVLIDRADALLPVTPRAQPDELLSSWLARQARFYGVGRLRLLHHCRLSSPSLEALDQEISFGQQTMLAGLLHREPSEIAAMRRA